MKKSINLDQFVEVGQQKSTPWKQYAFFMGNDADDVSAEAIYSLPVPATPEGEFVNKNDQENYNCFLKSFNALIDQAKRDKQKAPTQPLSHNLFIRETLTVIDGKITEPEMFRLEFC